MWHLFVPPHLIRLYRRGRLFLSRQRNRRATVQDVFTRVYAENRWGGESGEYCSGSGSTEQNAAVYAAVVNDFVQEREILRIVDLGCGDFVVGRKLLANNVEYIGVDVVAGLVRRNQQTFGSDNVSFRCLDIVSDPFPDGDLCLLRQVLQHLSNCEIVKVLEKTSKYRYVVITEHYPAPSVRVVPNREKPHGADIRVYDDSAVYLDLPPFNMTISRVLLEERAAVDLVCPGEVMKTFLLENGAQSIL